MNHKKKEKAEAFLKQVKKLSKQKTKGETAKEMGFSSESKFTNTYLEYLVLLGRKPYAFNSYSSEGNTIQIVTSQRQIKKISFPPRFMKLAKIKEDEEFEFTLKGRSILLKRTGKTEKSLSQKESEENGVQQAVELLVGQGTTKSGDYGIRY